jgi:hypothetical protein
MLVVAGFGGVASAATIGPLGVSVDVPSPTAEGVEIAAGVEVAAPGTQVGVDTSVGVNPTEGVDAKIDVGAGGGAVHVGGAVPLNGAPPQIDVRVSPPPLPELLPTPSLPVPELPAPALPSPALPTAPLPSSRAASGPGADDAPGVAGRASTHSEGATRTAPNDVVVDQADVSARLEPARRGGVWSSLGHAAARFGPWLFLLALAVVVNAIAKAALRDQRRFLFE